MMWKRRAFLAGCAACAAAYPPPARAAEGPLGHLDHSSWAVSDGAAGIAAFRKLGFTLTPNSGAAGGLVESCSAFGPEGSWTGD
jgi:hypothetical protein